MMPWREKGRGEVPAFVQWCRDWQAARAKRSLQRALREEWWKARREAVRDSLAMADASWLVRANSGGRWASMPLMCERTGKPRLRWLRNI